MKYLLITTTIILFLSSDLLAQSRREVLGYQNLFKPSVKVDEYAYAKKINNEIDFLASALFLFYKRNISSQDAVSCSFYPSCSVYAFQALHKKGAIVGSLMVFDRLTRCNALSPEKYKIHPETKLLYDPPE
jgi:uncharacterized protein